MVDISSLRVGVVPYTNVRPLEYNLKQCLPGASIIYDVPSSLAGKLSRGELDVAMVSSIELMRHPEYSHIPGLGICSDGPVRSVCMFSKKPPKKIETLALDKSSLSSAAMIRILYDEFWEHTPDFLSYTPPIEDGLKIADAVFSIGDPTLEFSKDGLLNFDLGEIWRDYCGLSFVYALWITRAGLNPEELAAPFNDAAQSGLDNLDEISERCSRKSSLSVDFFKDYYTRCIYYHPGTREMEGMRFFFDRARKFEE